MHFIENDSGLECTLEDHKGRESRKRGVGEHKSSKKAVESVDFLTRHVNPNFSKDISIWTFQAVLALFVLQQKTGFRATRKYICYMCNFTGRKVYNKNVLLSFLEKKNIFNAQY